MKYIAANSKEELEKKAQSLIGKSVKITQNPLIKDGVWYQIYKKSDTYVLQEYKIITSKHLQVLLKKTKENDYDDTEVFIDEKNNFCKIFVSRLHKRFHRYH